MQFDIDELIVITKHEQHDHREITPKKEEEHVPFVTTAKLIDLDESYPDFQIESKPLTIFEIPSMVIDIPALSSFNEPMDTVLAKNDEVINTEQNCQETDLIEQLANQEEILSEI